MTTIQDIPIVEYSEKQLAVREKSHLTDAEKYKKYLKSITLNLYNRYHNEDPVIREEFRNQRKVNNKRAYLLKKARLAEASRIAEEAKLAE